MKSLLSLCILFFSTVLFSQNDIDGYSMSTSKGYKIYFNNSMYCPVTVKISFELTNLKSDLNKQQFFVLPARTDSVFITELEVIDKKKGFSYRWNFEHRPGDLTKTKIDSLYAYSLPFESGSTIKIGQGYNGAFSHRNENALDFSMPKGSKILSSIEGVVVEVVDNNYKSCETRDCAKFNNFITVYHANGTFSQYSHIVQNSSLVQPGDTVKKGQLIAYTGDVGWTKGAHLHFVVYRETFEKPTRITLATKFLIDNGKTSVYLKEGESYTRNY